MPPVHETEERKLADSNGGGPRHPRPDRGGGGDGDDGNPDPNYIPGAGLLAMRLVLVSVSMLFITVGLAYYARSRSPVGWQHIRVPRLLWLSTALILASGWTLETARSVLEGRNSRRYRRWIGITLGIGSAFLASQLMALRELLRQGIYLRHNPHSSLFYVLTSAHGLHLLGGMAALCYLLVSAAWIPAATRPHLERLRSRTGVAALYWHFLTVLWLGLFLVLLVWP
ncbi:MAG: cytochrome c oxidase subunit 3 [Bryobacteraceae bacterium]